MKLGEVKESNGHDLGKRMVGEEEEGVESSRAIRGSWVVVVGGGGGPWR